MQEILNIKETVERARAGGYSRMSEYTLRRALRAGEIPCRLVGRTYLIAWSNVVRWITCADGCDNAPKGEETERGVIRRIEASA